MKILKNNNIIYLFLIINFVVLCGYNNANADLGEVTGLWSPTHNDNEPSSVTRIRMEWSCPDGYTDSSLSGYLISYTSAESHTYTYSNMPEIYNSKISLSEEYSGSGDTPIYFHIAAVDNTFPLSLIGPTKTFGPMFIDTESPTNAFVNVPDNETTTNEDKITLILGADGDPREMCISNIGYGNCTWELFTDYKTFLLEQGEQTVFVQYRDKAGNITNANPLTIIYNPSLVTTDIKSIHSIPTLNEWGIIIFLSILILFSIIIMKNKVLRSADNRF